MLTPFIDFALSAGPVLGAVVIVALLIVPCVIVALVLKKPHAGRKVDISIMGKFVNVKVEDSSIEPTASLTTGSPEASALPSGSVHRSRSNPPDAPAP